MRAQWLGFAAVLAVAAGMACPVVRAADGEAPEGLDAIRARIRAEAGVAETQGAAPADELPLVEVTILPGDTHKRLALDLTATAETVKLLAAVAPRLVSGKTLEIPRTLLRASLSDPGAVSFRIGEDYPSLWALAADACGATAPAETMVVVRNLQRLNHIPDAGRIAKGHPVRVPEALLARSRKAGPELSVFADYRVSNLKGLERGSSVPELDAALAKKLKKAGRLGAQEATPPLDLVVVHTTEHRGAPFENVARYLQKNRLANYLIGPDGEAYAIVPEPYRAYGCGQSLWNGRYGVDHGAINIEIYADTEPGGTYTGIGAAQYAGLKLLLQDIAARRPAIHPGRVITHRMAALSYRYETRSRKGDPFEFDWTAAGLPDNSLSLDQDVLLRRAKLCDDKRYADRVTSGQSAAADLLQRM